jgi:hypothetical protein
LTMKLKNLWLALLDQGPPRRFFRNFFITRHAWGLFHRNSHVAAGSGKPKVAYRTKASAEKAAAAMTKKNGVWFSNYKCMLCDGYHIGRNRDNKTNRV